MDQADGFWLVVALAFIFLGWYLVGGMWQRSVRATYVRRLGETAQLLSESRTMPRIRWLGQAGFQLVVDDAVAPYSKLSIVALLMPRESVALFLTALVRRRGDTITMRADLRERPRDARTASPHAPLTQLSFSRESPNVIAGIDGSWVRSRTPEDVAALLRRDAHP